MLFRLPAETAHEFVLNTLQFPFAPTFAKRFSRSAGPSTFGPIRRFGLEFKNPVGLAAGFDKNAVALNALANLGFGFIEVGTVTSQPQEGNPQPRVFRLPRDRALINRLGFNNCGAQCVALNLGRRPADIVIGVNIGKSRNVTIEDAIPDYLETFETIYNVADYIAVNVSSPNTPNLRELQQREHLEQLLRALQEKNKALALQHDLPNSKPLLLKIAPDLTFAEIESIIDVAMQNKIDGIIATNTTISRDRLRTLSDEIQACGEGGLSGAPLRTRSNEVISTIYRVTRGRLPIVGVGGVFSAEDAWEKICAGASLVQLYTGFIYEGPSIARRINEGLAGIMEHEQIKTIDQAVGCRVGL